MADEADSRFGIDRLHCTRATSVEQLHAHAAHVCMVADGGSLVACSAEGLIEFASGTGGAHIQCACWSPCGNFLILGERSGRIAFYHVSTQTDISVEHLMPQADDSLSSPQTSFLDMRCFEPGLGAGAEPGAASLLVLAAAGQLVHFENVQLGRVEASLRSAGENEDLEDVVDALREGITTASYMLPQDTARICISADRRQPRIYACGRLEMSVFDIGGGKLRLRDVTTVPVLNTEGVSAQPKGEEMSPSKRRRLLKEGLMDDEDLDAVACAPICFASSSATTASTCEHADGGDLEKDTLLAFVFQHPGIVVLYDASLLFEIHRWRPQRHEDILAAVPVCLPELSFSTDEDVSLLANKPLVSDMSIGICMVLKSGELLVCSFPMEHVLFSFHLGGHTGSVVDTTLSSVLLAAPSSKPLPLIALAESSTELPPEASSVVAFVSTVFASSASGVASEAVLSAVRCRAEDGADPGGLARKTLQILRRQVEHHMERARQGKSNLQAEPMLKLLRHLVPRLPVFVVNSVLNAQFADLTETCLALRGTLQLLQSETLPETYELGKGVDQLVETLNRLGTFQYLHVSLKTDGAEEDVEDSQSSRAQTSEDDIGSLKTNLNGAKSRRLSLPMCDVGGSPRKIPRRHSIGCAREAPKARQINSVERSIVELLKVLPSLQGRDFDSVWQRFRKIALPRICSDLIAAGLVSEAFSVMSRHGGDFQADDVMNLIECLPKNIRKEQEERLPFWIIQQAVPLLKVRERFLKWLIARAVLQTPDVALHLLGTFISNAMLNRSRQEAVEDAALPLTYQAHTVCIVAKLEDAACEGSWQFADAHMTRSMFWADSSAVFSAMDVGSQRMQLLDDRSTQDPDDGTQRMLHLFQKLARCKYLEKTHGLRLSVKDLHHHDMPKRVVTQMLDRVVTFPEEIRVHVKPFCERQRINVDESLVEYVSELAQMGLANGSMRLSRAANVLRCIGDVGRQAGCLMELLRECNGQEAEVPSELQPFVEEAASWPQVYRDQLQERLAWMDIQRIFTKHGLRRVLDMRDPSIGTLVRHLLSRVDSGAASLQDALSILRVCPQTYGRPEAIFFRLTHIAAAIEDTHSQTSAEELCREVEVAVACTVSPDERLTTIECFGLYCRDMLGSWAKAISECNSSCDDVLRARSAKLKSAATTLGKVATTVLQRAALSRHEAHSRWTFTCLLDALVRVSDLQEEFQIFVDPCMLQSIPHCGSAAVGSHDGVAHAVFQEQSAKFVKNFTSELCPSDAAQSHARIEGTTIGQGMALTQLLRLGALLGIGELKIQETLINEAASVGAISVCKLAMSEVLRVHSPESVASLVPLVSSLLRHFCERAEAIKRPAELVLQLSELEESIVSCISLCAPTDLEPLLELVEDVRFATELLFSSDFLDKGAVNESDARLLLQDLPVAHAHHFGHLHELECQLGAVDPEDAAEVDINIFQSTCLEVQVLMPAATATRAALDYLGSKHLSVGSRHAQQTCEAVMNSGSLDDSAMSDPSVFSSLFDLLRSHDCVELATALLLRKPEELPCTELRTICHDRSLHVLRAGNPVDRQLATAYISYLDVRDVIDVFDKMLSHSRPGRTQTEHLRLQHLAGFGRELAVLLGDEHFRTRMQCLEMNAMWCQNLALFDVPCDSARLIAWPGTETNRVLSDPSSCGTQEEVAEYPLQLLHQLIHASRFDFDVVLRFGLAYTIPREEVITLWVEAHLIMPASFAQDPCTQHFDETYQRHVTLVLSSLPSNSVDTLLFARVLPQLSPYDYDRIAFVLQELRQHPYADAYRQVLSTLQKHTRRSEPSDEESHQISIWSKKLEQQKPIESALDQVTREVRRLATQRLPWHSLISTNPEEPWLTLEPELSHYDSVATLLPLCLPLNLCADDFYITHINRVGVAGFHVSEKDHLAVGITGSPCISTSPSSLSLLLEIQDDQKALEVAAALQNKAPFGAELIAIAQCQLDIMRRSGAVTGETSVMEKYVNLLKSRWELAQKGFSIFQDIMVEHGVKECITCILHYVPILLMQPLRRGLVDNAADVLRLHEITTLIESARCVGTNGIHDLVDGICCRHGLSQKDVRHQLIKQWLLSPQWAPPHSPTVLSEHEAALRTQMTAGAPNPVAGETDAARVSSSAFESTQGPHMFIQTPLDSLCLERVAFTAQPRHIANLKNVPKDLREDVRARVMFLLKFALKETNTSNDAKCRALNTIFRIASPDQIQAAYGSDLEELLGIWKVYQYVDAFDRLGVPQDFKRLYKCCKETLARSLWDTHQSNPQALQVIASLCLDYEVKDGVFWASILSRLHLLRLDTFLKDVLVSLHTKLASGIPHDPVLVSTLIDLHKAPIHAIGSWFKDTDTEMPPGIANWLPAIPYLLRQSPFIAEFEPVVIARQLLAVTHAPNLPAEALDRLARATFDARAIAGSVDAVSSCRSEQWRSLFGELVIDISVCDVCSSRLESFASDIATNHPELILAFLPRHGSAIRNILFKGVLHHRLVAEARRRVGSELFGELVEYAIDVNEIDELLEAALKAGQLDNAFKLLLRFGKVHGLADIGDLLLDTLEKDLHLDNGARDESTMADDCEAASYLRQLFKGLRISKDLSETFRDFANHVCGQAELGEGSHQ